MYTHTYIYLYMYTYIYTYTGPSRPSEALIRALLSRVMALAETMSVPALINIYRWNFSKVSFIGRDSQKSARSFIY